MKKRMLWPECPYCKTKDVFAGIATGDRKAYCDYMKIP
jgi:hypothetical protein